MDPLSGRNTNLICQESKKLQFILLRKQNYIKNNRQPKCSSLSLKEGTECDGTLGKYTQETAVSMLYVLPLVRSVPADSPAIVSF